MDWAILSTLDDNHGWSVKALRSEVLSHVMPSPSSGTDTDKLMKCPRERCLIIKSQLSRDVDQRHGGVSHQLLGVVNAMLHQALVSGSAETDFERAGKVTDGK